MRTLYVDLDSTLWPAEDLYTDALTKISMTDFLMQDLYKDNDQQVVNSFIDAILNDDIDERELYPGAAASLTELVWEHEFDVVIITHNPKPEERGPGMEAWLRREFPFDFEFKAMEAEHCKIETMQEDENAWGIIEDKPATLVKAAEMGYNTYALLHPWNLKTVKEHTGIRGSAHWSDLQVMITHDARLASVQ